MKYTHSHYSWIWLDVNQDLLAYTMCKQHKKKGSTGEKKKKELEKGEKIPDAIILGFGLRWAQTTSSSSKFLVYEPVIARFVLSLLNRGSVT